jgi:hypothetical protein
MDYAEPKTRKETKGGKYKATYSQKHVRQLEALQAKRNAAAGAGAPGAPNPRH